MSSSNNSASLALMYHRIGSPLTRSIVSGQYVLPTSFRAQLSLLLRRGYQPRRLIDIVTHPEYAAGSFTPTFDDAYANFRRAYPILRELGAPATIFVVAGFIGKTNEWDQRIGDCVEHLLTRDDLRELDAAGIEIGSHTLTHAHLTTLTDADLRAELQDSKKMLEDVLGKPVAGFAYPYGEWDERVREAVIAAGYRYAAITTRGAIGASGDPYTTPRVNIRWNTVGPLLSMKLHDVYDAPGQFVPKPYKPDHRKKILGIKIGKK